MNERMRILNMLAEGKVSAEEAALLLQALDASAQAPKEKPRWLRIRVSEAGTEKVKVNIPLALARMGIALLPSSTMVQINAKGIDLDRLLDEELPAAGKIVDIQEGDSTVEIYVE